MTESKTRTCGEPSERCSECCVALALTHEGIVFKPPHFPCWHRVSGHGCGVYGNRFSGCRRYGCGYLIDEPEPVLDDDQRPDKTGIVPTWRLLDEDAGIPRVILLVESRPGALRSEIGFEVLARYLARTGIMRVTSLSGLEVLFVRARMAEKAEAYIYRCRMLGIEVYLVPA